MTRSHLSEPTMAQTREEPVEQIIEGLMRQHADSILRLCLMILQDYHLAEDAMQDTFLKAYRILWALQGRQQRLHLADPHRHQHLQGCPPLRLAPPHEPFHPSGRFA